MKPQGQLNMDAIITQVHDLAKTADEAGRKKILDSLRDLSYSLETREDTAQRVMYQNLQLAVLRISCDLKLFEILVESPVPLTLEVLAQKTGTDPLLLGRILRFLSSVSIIKETTTDTFTQNNITKNLRNTGVQGGIYHNFDVVGPAIQALPDYLLESHYQNITDAANSPFQKGHNTELPGFIWYQTKPDLFAHFNQFMAEQLVGMPSWLDVYPWQEKSEGLKPEQPFFIDLGGGIGHQSVALREKLPRLPNRIIVQDIPVTLQHAIKHPGIETIAQDFFQPQAIEGSRIYYMRNIIHDYPDQKALIILKNTKAALGPDSVILIDDMVLPNEGVHWHATQYDMVMMTSLASMERTKAQWESLLEKAGLKINNVYTYTSGLRNSIIECVPV